MKTLFAMLFAVAVSNTFAAQEDYQMTGPVVQMDDAKIVIEKDGVSREFARDSATKTTGKLKVGGKATVHYKMVAISAEAKDDAPSSEKEADKAKPKK